nr:MAG TPA: Lipopolysaccharide assembly protein A domain [Caudoviricetes sp.]
MENILWVIIMIAQVIGFIWALIVVFISNRELKRHKSLIKSQEYRLAQTLELYNLSLVREGELLKELEEKDKHV